MTNEELKAIEERANKATPGPWEAWQGDNDRYWTMGDPPLDKLWNVDSPAVSKWIARKVWEGADAEFIAHAREDIPALVARVKELEEQDARN